MIRFLATATLISLALLSKGQSYYKNIIKDKVTVVDSGQTVIARVSDNDTRATISNQKTYYWYSANKIHTTQGGYSGRLLDGTYTSYYQNKNLKEQGGFNKGLKHQEWKSWNESGQLLTVEKWKKGRKVGRTKEYGADGKLVAAHEQVGKKPKKSLKSMTKKLVPRKKKSEKGEKLEAN